MWLNDYGEFIMMTKKAFCKGILEFSDGKIHKNFARFHYDGCVFCLTFLGGGITIMFVVVYVSAFSDAVRCNFFLEFPGKGVWNGQV